jgi:hypothetical protein
MKKLAWLGALPLIASAPPPGIYLSAVDGEMLHQMCDTPQSVEEQCKAYIIGVSDAITVQGLVCRPAGVTNTQLKAIVVNRLRARPQDWHFQGYFTVRDALKAAFPCPRNR